MDITWDIESNNLLNRETIDYTASPYKLKPSFSMHCIVVEEHATGKLIAFYDGPTYVFDGREYAEQDAELGYTYELKDYVAINYEHKQLDEFKPYIESNPLDKVVAHNSINFDHLAVKLYYGMDYTVGPDTWCGKPVEIIDTMVLSKTLNPDRFGGHSLDKLSEKVGLRKIDFRPYCKDEHRFVRFAADMLYYCIRDVQVNTRVYKWLLEEKGDWPWDDAITLEKAVAELITRQEHRGFKFNKELAEANIEELDNFMEERKAKIEPILPKKKATKGYMDDFTPPVKQILKNGQPTSYLTKFAEKIGAEIVGEVTAFKLVFDGKEYPLPLALEPLVTEQVATINDTTHIKEWLVGSFNWNPSEYKERDLSVNSKKIKLTPEKRIEAIEKYVEQTLNSPFCSDRCDFLETTPAKLKAKLLGYKEGRAIKVLTNPSFTKGQEKEICPDLLRISSDFPYAKDIVEYLTFKHRRNSILGGGLEWDDEEEAEKGYMAYIREDGRIPTPADTCGAATSRMKHRVCANIPRVTSLYGEKMRGLFGVDSDFVQIGYDFDSLEARIEAHYCWKYDEDKEYCHSLTQDKPNDVHTKLSLKISDIIGRAFARSPAKNVKYGCLPTDSTLVLTPSGWKDGRDVSVGDVVMGYNNQTRQNEWTTVLATYLYEDADVKTFGNDHWAAEATADHRWYGSKLKQYGSKKKAVKVIEDAIFTTEEIKQTYYILNTAPFIGGNSSVLPHQAALVGWILADGYYKWSERSENTSASGGKRKGIIGSIAQASHKFQAEIIEVISANGMNYKEGLVGNRTNKNEVTSYRLESKDLRDFFDSVVGCRKQKHEVDWCSWILGLTREALQAFVHAFWLADGDSKGREQDTFMTFKQLRGNIADALVLAGYLLGYNVTQRGGRISNVRFQKKRVHTTTQEFRTYAERKTQVFCLTTELDTFVIKQNGIITITGNCTYGAQEAKVAKTIGSDLATGKIVFDAFWLAAFPLGNLKENLQKYWETVGSKKFILGIDKRKVPTRSAHAILNSLFQSGGVICAKRAMIIHDRKLKAEGLAVDFFKDDWKQKLFANQLIAYHDEAQLEVHKNLVKWRVGKSKEEMTEIKAQVEKETNLQWSDVGHIGDKWYIGYCRAGELAVESVLEAGRYYKLNVDLTAGYMLGKDWASCH